MPRPVRDSNHLDVGEVLRTDEQIHVLRVRPTSRTMLVLQH